MNFVIWYHDSHYFSSFWPSFSFSLILGEVPEEGDPEDLWSKPVPKGLRLPPLRSLLDNELLMLLRVLVMPLVWRRDSTGLSSRSSKIGMLSRAWTSQEAQSGIFCSCAYLSLVTDRSARTSRAPNIAPAERKLTVIAEAYFSNLITLVLVLYCKDPTAGQGEQTRWVQGCLILPPGPYCSKVG